MILKVKTFLKFRLRLRPRSNNRFFLVKRKREIFPNVQKKNRNFFFLSVQKMRIKSLKISITGKGKYDLKKKSSVNLRTKDFFIILFLVQDYFFL